jgi:uncharacterized protein YaiI (UPF0178 family)
MSDPDEETGVIFVDGDACPVVQDVVELARQADRDVVLVHNRHHEMADGPDHVEVHETGDRSDAADHYIYNNASPEDVVVTDDLGLATLILSRGADVVRFRGDQPTREDIEMRLAMREASRRERAKNNRVSGPPEFTESDRRSFRRTLRRTLGLEDPS